MPGRFELKSTLVKIWHIPDSIRFMAPLPPMHRRGIIAGVLLVIIGVLLPASDHNSVPAISRDAPPSMPVPQETSVDIAADPIAPVAPQPVQETEEPSNARMPAPPPVQQQPLNIEQPWHSYHVEQGETLVQLFRNHHLAPTDVYAMVKVEGAGKPLSTLKIGQLVQIRQDENGQVIALTIDTSNDQQALFTRQPDGSFIRVR